MCSGEEFFRIRANAVFKARAERVLRLFEDAAIRRNRALPIFQTTLPYRGCFALHDFSPFGSFILFESREFDSRASWKGIFRKWPCRESFVIANERGPAGSRAPALDSARGTVGDGAVLARPALCALAGRRLRIAPACSSAIANRHV